MVNVVVSRRRNVKISSNATGGIIDTTVPVTIRAGTGISTGTGNVVVYTTVDELLDVNIQQRVDGSTLVYDTATDTYVVKPLEFFEMSGDLDGGTF